eukprot:CAMPEP_0201528174 /NCGR_PEP_ID=MMETSP0161_2-20130828/37535_1 /ASSEMBLY_ACC=CAM_ASM_000251 /TAXON_ID=180227 /ORGANISM="Neoparamoeba aestuarina, Strain SoJaBio B1-5/56/2" /LENGTH=316 /DNA_ID=CAMNT_0047929343 /DNA_START=215 /DNA_END=1165 /DNA_ORIENTATION=-
MSVFLFAWHVCSWTAWTLMIRASRGDADRYEYDTVTVVLGTELFKLVLSIIFHYAFHSPNKWKEETNVIVGNYRVAIYYAVPAIIYSVYNVLMYLNLTLFTPTNYRVLINIRVLWSGLLFQLIFRTKLGAHKWAGLLVLAVGCAVNQLGSDFRLDSGLLALVSIGFQAFLSSAGGVYSELLLKDNIEIPLVVKNIYLYFWSTLGNILFICFFRPQLLVRENFFRGWDGLVIGLVIVGAFCGFSTAVFLRYLNVLLKEFAHSAEMLLTAVLTAIFFGAPLTVNVLVSIFLVAIAIYLCNQPNASEKKTILPVNETKD